ncbi:hypothetical protein CTAYLR_000999 [Chrysophaeum taylorii]|uniref:COG complex component COG2 C-terminal domain-containing protein n=1 Tax=Chrysophaeum taylorii TaxID=2483200 RepID=A0AAD7XLM9_9STRA|nr:hypothetical protein CTAYLR_000999 [Chrysophaeum taylorii]
MQRALEEERSAISEAMFELMSSKYGEFFRVAESLTLEVRESRDAFIELHGHLARALEEARSRRRELEAEVEKRRAARKQRREASAIERFEALLCELEKEEGDVERSAHASLSLRAQLSSAVEIVSDGSLVTKMHEFSQRVDEAEAATILGVEAAFERLCCASTNRASDDEGRRAALRAAAALGLGRRLEDRYGERLLGEFLAVTFTQGRLDGADRGSCAGLPSIYAATLDFVQERCGPALVACETAMAPGDPRPSLLAVDLVCNGVWRPIAAAICEKLASIFDLGIAATAHRCYSATFRFLEDLSRVATGETSATSARAAYVSRRLRAHPATRRLEANWNLPVYFELVKVDVVARLDAVLFPEKDDLVVVGGGEVSPSPFVRELLSCVDHIWEPDPAKNGAFLRPLAHDLVRLTFDVVSKTLRASAEALDADLAPHQLAQLAYDVHDLAAALNRATPPKVARALRGTDRALPEEAPIDAFFLALDQSALRPVRSIKTRALDRLADELSHKTAESLRAVKGVSAKYILTNEPRPVAPSDYLDRDAFRWLIDDFDNTWRDKLPTTTNFRASVSSRIMDAFSAMVKDVLDNALKVRDTLRKREEHKRNNRDTTTTTTNANNFRATSSSNSSGNDANAATTDTQKIAMQLMLDVDHLQARLDRFSQKDISHDRAAFDVSSLDRVRASLRDTISPPTASTYYSDF